MYSMVVKGKKVNGVKNNLIKFVVNKHIFNLKLNQFTSSFFSIVQCCKMILMHWTSLNAEYSS